MKYVLNIFRSYGRRIFFGSWQRKRKQKKRKKKKKRKEKQRNKKRKKKKRELEKKKNWRETIEPRIHFVSKGKEHITVRPEKQKKTKHPFKRMKKPILVSPFHSAQ